MRVSEREACRPPLRPARAATRTLAPVIVNDVVNAGTSAVERLHRRQCRIIDVNERPHTRTAADDRHLPLSHLLDKVASLPERIARSIKPSVAKSNSGRSGKACDRLFQ